MLDYPVDWHGKQLRIRLRTQQKQKKKQKNKTYMSLFLLLPIYNRMNLQACIEIGIMKNPKTFYCYPCETKGIWVGHLNLSNSIFQAQRLRNMGIDAPP